MLVATTAEGRGVDKGWTVLFSGPRRLWVKSGHSPGGAAGPLRARSALGAKKKMTSPSVSARA
jgi:hypothetical protein